MLQKYRYAMTQHIATENLRITAYEDMLSDTMVIRLCADIYGESLKKVHKVYPSNWKEALKDRFLPKFLHKVFPIKYDVIEVEAAALYPRYVLPEHQYGPVRVAVIDTSRSYWKPEPIDD
jgi:hypothetical protein